MKKNIFLVDDDDVFRFLGTKILNRMGITEGIHTARNGKEALEYLYGCIEHKFEYPEIILLDINMPIMDGFDFLKAYQKMDFDFKPNIKVIMLSSSDDAEDKQRALELGSSKFISKPISEKILMPLLT
jgi:CheY-like chemotaxis protein